MILFLCYVYKMQQQPVHMATPLSKLPLKTSRPPDTSDIEDPMIQNVLKEFEDEMVKQNNEQQQYQFAQKMPEQPVYHAPQQPHHQPQYQAAPQAYPQQMLPPNGQFAQPKKLLDMNILKKTAIITIIVFLLQNYNIMKIIMSKLPETATKHITGKEMFINLVIIFVAFYALMYYELL